MVHCIATTTQAQNIDSQVLLEQFKQTNDIVLFIHTIELQWKYIWINLCFDNLLHLEATHILQLDDEDYYCEEYIQGLNDLIEISQNLHYKIIDGHKHKQTISTTRQKNTIDIHNKKHHFGAFLLCFCEIKSHNISWIVYIEQISSIFCDSSTIVIIVRCWRWFWICRWSRCDVVACCHIPLHHISIISHIYMKSIVWNCDSSWTSSKRLFLCFCQRVSTQCERRSSWNFIDSLIWIWWNENIHSRWIKSQSSSSIADRKRNINRSCTSQIVRWLKRIFFQRWIIVSKCV